MRIFPSPLHSARVLARAAEMIFPLALPVRILEMRLRSSIPKEKRRSCWPLPGYPSRSVHTHQLLLLTRLDCVPFQGYAASTLPTESLSASRENDMRRTNPQRWRLVCGLPIAVRRCVESAQTSRPCLDSRAPYNRTQLWNSWISGRDSWFSGRACSHAWRGTIFHRKFKSSSLGFRQPCQ